MNLADSPLLKLESSFEATALIRLDFVLTQLGPVWGVHLRNAFGKCTWETH